MNLVPSKLGAEPKKIVILGGLVVAAAAVYFYNSNSGGGPASSPASASRVTLPGAAQRPAAKSGYRNVQPSSGGAREFKPSLRAKDIDTATVDPTLRLDLLAKLKTVDVEAGTRSLFEIGAAPPAEIKTPEPAKIAITRPFVGPVQAPPIPLKFYGFVNKTKVGDKRAFFLDGEDIVIAGEGDVIKKHYKIIRIGVNSAVVEDTDFKSNNQQTLPLEQEMAG